MATTSFTWNDGSGDKIHLSYRDNVGNLNILIDSDDNTGRTARSMTLNITTGNISRRIIVNQPAPLPYDTEIEYLESNGNQFIEIPNFNLNSDNIIKLRIMYTSNSSGNTYGCFTSSTATDNFCLYSGYRSNNSYIRFDGEIIRAFKPSTNTIYNIKHSQQGFMANNVTYATFAQATFTCSSNLRIFALPNSTSAKIKAKIYYFNVENNNDIILDFIPVRIGNIGYMYDKVSGQLFGNAGTGNFTLGPDVTSSETN